MIEIRISEELWVSRMLPEGLVERWLVPDGAEISRGQPLIMVRIEDALHEITAPAPGRLSKLLGPQDLIEPGSIVGTLE